MFRSASIGEVNLARDLTNTLRTVLLQQFEDPKTTLVGEGFENFREISDGRRFHNQQSNTF